MKRMCKWLFPAFDDNWNVKVLFIWLNIGIPSHSRCCILRISYMISGKHNHLSANNNTSRQYHSEGWLTKLCRCENHNSQYKGNNLVTLFIMKYSISVFLLFILCLKYLLVVHEILQYIWDNCKRLKIMTQKTCKIPDWQMEVQENSHWHIKQQQIPALVAESRPDSWTKWILDSDSKIKDLIQIS